MIGNRQKNICDLFLKTKFSCKIKVRFQGILFTGKTFRNSSKTVEKS